ncbi:MAG: GNAT family N-acetyltransferase [Saprospiraceae bacterium]|nr:GNAT family N-acetyltransferase [Saprospiraceae bacterium]
MLLNISTANPGDIPALLPMINSAYRGESSKKGWTTEADLLSGELRTDADNLKALLEKPGAVILQLSDAEGALAGCVFLEKRGQRLYLGMLTVWPERQAQGIGKQLLAAAEAHARQQECNAIFMRVLSGRSELIQWYERHGYAATGERQPYDAPPQFGVPRRDLDFILMEKPIR